MSIDLKAIEKRYSRATEGPWRQQERDSARILSGPPAYFMVCERADDDDAEFIAAAREDVPALVARVRELEAGIKSALDVAGSSSVPLGVTEARHWDRLLAETRRVLFSALEGATE